MKNQLNDVRISHDMNLQGHDTEFDYRASTKRQTLDDKKITLPACLILLLSDLCALIFMILVGYDALTMLFPIIFVGLDAVFFALSIKVSFKFKYARWYVAIYGVALVVATALAVYFWALSSQVIMTFIALIVFAGTHLALFLLLVIALVVSCKRKLFAGILATLFMLCACGFSVAYNYHAGIFGQHISPMDGVKTLVYELDEDGENYIAKNFLNDKSQKIIVPTQFNGKPVKYIDVNLFSATDVKSFEIQSKEISFVADENSKVTDNKFEILAGKGQIDGYRNQLLTLAREKNISQLYSVSNYFSPNDLEKNQTMVLFDYDFENLDGVINGDYILSDFTTGKASYSESDIVALNGCFKNYSDNPVEQDYLINYELGNGYYIKKLTVDGGDGLVGKDISNGGAIHVGVEFGKIIKVNVLEDNDEKTVINNFLNTTNVYNSQDYGRYIVDSDSLFDEVVARSGFSYDCSLLVKANSNTVSNETVEISQAKSKIDSLLSTQNKIEIDLGLQWIVNAPTVSAKADAVTYGENVVVDVTATGECIKLNYKLYKGEAEIATVQDHNTFTLSGKVPNDSGEYVAVVYAENSAVTSLKSEEIRVPFNLIVNKKALSEFTWGGDDGFNYDGTEHDITCAYTGTEKVGTDVIDVELSLDKIKDAGNYTPSISLTGDCADKYYISQNKTKTYTINKTPISVVWTSTTTTYNGEAHAPVISAINGAVSGEEAGIIEKLENNHKTSGDNINAGSFTEDLSFPEDIKNYVFDGSQAVECTINPRPITVATWANTNSLVYDGKAQRPSVDTFDQVVPGEENIVKSYLVYDGAQTNAGSHTVTVSLKQGSNYVFETITLSTDYIIKQKPITVATWADTNSLVYNGEAQRPSVDTLDQVVSGEEDTVKGYLIYSGEQTNAGENYTVTVSLNSGSNYVFNEPQSTTYRINKRTIDVVWGALTFEYDGNIHCPSVTEINNGVEGQEASLLSNLSYSLGNKNAGNYTVEVNPENDNYTISNPTQNYTITQKEITVKEWDNLEFVYDGNAHRPNVKSLDGIVATDNESNIINTMLVYNSDGQINAGTYQITVGFLDSSTRNYKFANNNMVTTDYVINKVETALVWTGVLSFDENGQQHAPSVISDGQAYVLGFKATYTYYNIENPSTPIDKPSEAGSYKVVVVAESTNYTFTNTEIEFTINAVNIEE